MSDRTDLLTPRKWAWDLYGKTVEAARSIYGALEHEDKKPGDLFWPENIIRKLWLHLKEGDSELLSLSTRSVPGHFLFAHVPNVTIVSLRLGSAIGLEEEDGITLGMSAFLSEIGLAPMMELSSKVTRLTTEEYALLRRHVEEGVQLLDLFPVPSSGVKDVVKQVLIHCHERFDGSGYPKGLSQGAIHPFAKMIGLADTYEAMTHPRPWRERTLPHDVLRSWVENNEEGFDPLLIRALVDALGFYPPGTYVRLNDGRVGRVMETTPDLPLRPKVSVFLDGDNRPLKTVSRADLVVSPHLFVVEAVDESCMTIPDARLSMELRAQAWWVL